MSVRRKPLPNDVPPRLNTADFIEEIPTPFGPQRSNLGSAQPELDVHHVKNKIASVTVDSPPKYIEYDLAGTRAERRITPRSPLELEYVQSPLSSALSSSWTPTNDTDTFHSVGLGSPNHSPGNDLIAEQYAQSNKSERKARLATALQDASHFLGGLIKHPTESTKNFTILRHSHGLVYYKGPTTSVAITVFAAKPLPPNRRYWFQMKGWTGHAGMRAKALLRTNTNWINVTPIQKANTADLPPTDERAWQRDISKFRDKAPKNLQKHIARETAVIRVPFEAIDGYFRVVLTGADDRSALCPSPVFRVASTSMSLGSIKGASLSTLPLELSISILQFAAKTATSNFIAPYAESARNQITSNLPSVVSKHGQTVYDLSGAQDRIAQLNQEYDDRRQLILEESQNTGIQYVPTSRPDLVGEDQGPDLPFPERFESKVVPGSGIGTREVGMPTANLADPPPEAIATFEGVYFGWAFVSPKDKAQRELHADWRHAIITIAHDHARTAVAIKKVARVYLLQDFGGQQFYDAKISLVVMGYLRPVISYEHKEAFFSETMRDIEITRLSLQREEWSPTSTLHRISTAKSSRSFSEKYLDTRTAIQRQIDTIPVHRLGIRNQNSGSNDRGLYGNGGLYVIRDDP